MQKNLLRRECENSVALDVCSSHVLLIPLSPSFTSYLPINASFKDSLISEELPV